MFTTTGQDLATREYLCKQQTSSTLPKGIGFFTYAENFEIFGPRLGVLVRIC
jgi:hypothetical protein